MWTTQTVGTVKGMAEGLHVQREVLGNRNVAQFNAALFNQHLPRHNVRMVLHFSEKNGIAFLQICSSPSMSHEVDKLPVVAVMMALEALNRCLSLVLQDS